MWCSVILRRYPTISTKFTRLYHYKPKDSHRSDAAAVEKYAVKDILLFRYENPRKILYRNIMAAGVLVGSCIMGHTAWNLRSELKNFIEKGGQSYEEKMKEQGNLIWIVHQASGKIGIIFCLFGLGLSTYWFLRTSHTIRRLILKKGGKHCVFVTYGVFGINSRHFTVPVIHVSGCWKGLLTFSIKNTHLIYDKLHVICYNSLWN